MLAFLARYRSEITRRPALTTARLRGMIAPQGDVEWSGRDRLDQTGFSVSRPEVDAAARRIIGRRLKVELAIRNATANVPPMSPASVPQMSR